MEQKVEQNSSIFNSRVFRTPLIIVGLYLTIEILYRLFTFGFHTVHNWKDYNPRGILLTNIVMPVDQADVSWKLRPDVNTIFKTQPFTTNSLGMRSPELHSMDTSQATRIIVLGRSITMGSGVSDDEVYTRVLQSYLEEWKPEKYEVINCAVGGYTVEQMVNFFEHYLRSLEPDIVLFPISKDDLLVEEAPPILPLALAKPSITNLNSYLSYTFLFVNTRFLVKRTTNAFISTNWKYRAMSIVEPRPDAVSNERIVADFVQRRVDEGIPCYFYSPDRNPKRDLQKDEMFKRWANEHTGAFYLPINEYMDGRMPETMRIYFGDNHPSPELHALLAEALYNEFSNGIIKATHGS